MFGRGEAIAIGDAVTHFGGASVEALITCGMAAQHNGVLRPLACIVTFEGLLVAGDLAETRWEADYVAPISATTRLLAACALERPVTKAVDLGCGTGVLALRLAAHAQHVIAVDINPRAISYTEINAALNGFTNIDAREGSLLEPLDGEHVDLVAGNLPFVMSPEQRFLYRDGDRLTEALVQDAIDAASRHLTTAGVAQLLCNWATEDSDPSAGPRRLTANTGCDVLAIEYARRTAIEHARHWLTETRGDANQNVDDTIERWVEWFAARSIATISFGSLAIRRPVGRPGRFRHLIASSAPNNRAAQQIEGILQALNEPDALHDHTLRPRLVAHHLIQTLTHDGTSYAATPTTLVPIDSAGITLTVPANAAPLLFEINGETPIAALTTDPPHDHTTLTDLWHHGLLRIGIPDDPTSLTEVTRVDANTSTASQGTARNETARDRSD
jgi:SAM-dependent methyltransferase